MPSDDTLWLYTSLTAGSSHIITATSRIETILKANKIPFKAVDIATNEKARLIWQRRSKGKKIPGLVKFNDVVADLEQIEEWNEYGELEDELEAIIDIFGDVPVSSTSAEAHAAAAERANAQAQQGAGGSSQARTASETRHISISDPKSDKKKDDGINRNDSPMSVALRQAGAEAAAKAGQKKSASAATSTPATAPVPVKTPEDVNPPETKPAATSSTTLESEESSTVTDAKTPGQLAFEGASRTSLDKIATADSTGEAAPSTMAQTLSQSRKSSVPNTPSSLAKSTSISESHTVSTSSASTSTPSLSSTTSGQTERPRAQHRGSDLEAATPETIKEIEKRNSIAEVDEEDDDDDEEEEEESSEEEKEEQGAAKKLKTATGTATATGATDKEEKKVMGGTKTQEQGAKDGESAGISVGD